MSSLLSSMLVYHVLIGLSGLIALHFAYMQLIRRTPPYTLIIKAAWVSVILLFASWITGAYYYVVHYGTAVKPRILASAYPWAHSFFMEAKEHVFILMPFLTIVFALGMHTLKRSENPTFKRALAFLGAFVLILGVFITASGIIISGAVR